MLGEKPDEHIRTPMQWDASANAGFTSGTPWEAVNPDPSDVNVESELADPSSLLNRYRTLLADQARPSGAEPGRRPGLARQLVCGRAGQPEAHG